MLKIIKEHKDPVFCIITPLRPEDKVSKDTKISVKRNKTPFIWATYQSEGNVAHNYKMGLQALSEHTKLPLYAVKIDNDTVWQRNTLDNMVNVLKTSPDNIAYCYCSFEYKGSVNKKFPAKEFDANELRRMNYISSNSLFKTKVLEEVELVTDDKYKRLLDWAYFLKLLNNGYYGIPCKNGYFIAKASKDSVSAGGADDFKLKYKRVIEDFRR